MEEYCSPSLLTHFSPFLTSPLSSPDFSLFLQPFLQPFLLHDLSSPSLLYFFISSFLSSSSSLNPLVFPLLPTLLPAFSISLPFLLGVLPFIPLSFSLHPNHALVFLYMLFYPFSLPKPAFPTDCCTLSLSLSHIQHHLFFAVHIILPTKGVNKLLGSVVSWHSLKESVGHQIFILPQSIYLIIR